MKINSNTKVDDLLKKYPFLTDLRELERENRLLDWDWVKATLTE